MARKIGTSRTRQEPGHQHSRTSKGVLSRRVPPVGLRAGPTQGAGDEVPERIRSGRDGFGEPAGRGERSRERLSDGELDLLRRGATGSAVE